MSEEKAAAKAAQAILRRLTAKGGIEATHPEKVQAEIVEALERYERTLQAVTAAVLEEAASLTRAQTELERRSLEADVPLDDEALPDMVDELSQLLLDSEHVDDLFVDDDELDKIVRAALLDYLPAIAAQERSKLASAFVRPRTLLADPKPDHLTAAAAGYAFPLFEASLESANVDEAGPCAHCEAVVEVRFSKACFACFRAGKVTSYVMDTELGMVRAEDAEEGLVHGAPKSAAPRGYDLVEMGTAVGDTEPWVRVRVDKGALTELLRTPKYETWQGERWLFCCQRPMVYVGPMKEPLLERLREAQETQEEVVGRLLQSGSREAHERTQQVLKGRISMYVFHCPQCRKHRAHWDCA